MINSSMIDATSRVALAAMLHDLGKMAERARIEVNQETLEANVHQYCPRQERGGRVWHTHKHAAYSAIGIDLLEAEGLLPPIKGSDLYPFKDWRGDHADDSLINAAARHHRPETPLQWILATADRVASGFEREKFDQYNQAEENTSTGRNHYTARQLTLFEQIRIERQDDVCKLQWRYRLSPMTIDSLMPTEAIGYEQGDNSKAQGEYLKLWDAFLEGLRKIPDSHRANLALWLDHFDSCWAIFSQAVPSATAFGVRPEVSLYDHSKATTALATALWRYQEDSKESVDRQIAMMRDRQDWDQKKFLLVQGDLFGIQDFIFSSGGATRKRAAKLLRGRSFYVSLLTECAALRVMDALNLPATSQVINAAGKFLIVAPNTPETINTLQDLRNQLDDWFLQHTWGQAGVGMAWTPASCNDFLRNGQGEGSFDQLLERLFDALDQAKRQRFDLCGTQRPTTFDGFLDQFDSDKGVCQVDDRSPATTEIDEGVYVSTMAKDQINIGRWLVDKDRLLVSREPLNHNTLKIDLFGYYINFTNSEEVSGKFGRIAAEGKLLRAWDFSLAQTSDEVLFHGYARRWINGYVPHFSDTDNYFKDRYQRLKKSRDELDQINPGETKTLNHIACEDLYLDEDQKTWLGVDALMTLKGDIDNLGTMFQSGLKGMTFAKMAALSRQVNAFFAVWLPWYCQQNYPNTYTIFAGGDDFFLIGPWRSQMNLARDLRREFARYVTGNPEIHFSAGLSMSRPGLPIRYLAERGESALEEAKKYPQHQKNVDRKEGGNSEKNAVTCHGETISWDTFEQLSEATDQLDRLSKEMQFSTGYVYGMLSLVNMAENLKARPENAIWHSRFAYRTRRFLERKRGLNEEQIKRMQNEITLMLAANGIDRYKGGYRIALTTYLYRYRKTGE